MAADEGDREAPPATRESLEQEINRFRADLSKWKDDSAKLQPRWHAAALWFPVVVFVVGLAAALFTSELLVAIGSLLPALEQG